MTLAAGTRGKLLSRRVPPVAVAVVSWNTRDLLARCLESLQPEVSAGRAHVWVVDNGSTDGSAQMVAERFEWADVIAHPDNLGFGRAVNLVAREAGEWEWLAPANADIALQPGALEALLAAGAADPGAGAIAPRLLREDGSTEESVLPFPTLRFTVAFNAGLARPWWEPERPGRVPWAIGAFLLLRRAAWDATGGFDENRWMYAEDLDLGWRLREAGWPTRYEPGARILHTGGAATSQAFGDVEVRKQRETYAWLRSRRGPAATAAIAATNVAGAGVRAAAKRGWERERWRGYLRQHVNGWRESS
jgi:N-acetylglucosaminyl-diphospho-decaprenol L-rhamnosyltransferase